MEIMRNSDKFFFWGLQETNSQSRKTENPLFLLILERLISRQIQKHRALPHLIFQFKMIKLIFIASYGLFQASSFYFLSPLLNACTWPIQSTLYSRLSMCSTTTTPLFMNTTSISCSFRWISSPFTTFWIFFHFLRPILSAHFRFWMFSNLLIG